MICDSRAPENGADSDWNPRPFRVQLRDEEGPSWWMTVNAAIGPRDARQQALQRAHDEGGEAVGVLKVEPSGFYDDPNAEGER